MEEKFHAERHGNVIECNREPETDEELDYLGALIQEAMGYAFISGTNTRVLYPVDSNNQNKL